MTRRRGRSYPVDDDWRSRVIERMGQLGMSRAELARAVGCSPSVITEILNGSANESPSIPAIHDALGWTPPSPLRLSEDVEELLAVWRQLDDADRLRLLERAASLLESGKRRQ